MNPRYALIIAAITMLLILSLGTVFYHFIEKWDWIDSFYFTGITITTIGYGDITPITNTGKIFTVIFALSSVGVFLFIINNLMNTYMQRYVDRTHRDITSIERYFSKPKYTKYTRFKKMPIVVEKKHESK